MGTRNEREHTMRQKNRRAINLAPNQPGAEQPERLRLQKLPASKKPAKHTKPKCPSSPFACPSFDRLSGSKYRF